MHPASLKFFLVRCGECSTVMVLTNILILETSSLGLIRIHRTFVLKLIIRIVNI
jgi:hypothetical protein